MLFNRVLTSNPGLVVVLPVARGSHEAAAHAHSPFKMLVHSTKASLCGSEAKLQRGMDYASPTRTLILEVSEALQQLRIFRLLSLRSVFVLEFLRHGLQTDHL